MLSRPRCLPATSRALILAALGWGGMAWAAEKEKPAEAKEGGKVAASGIFTDGGNGDSITVLTDGEEQAVKYVFGEGFDKKTLKGIFTISRVQFTYSKKDDGRKLLSIKKEPPQARGTVTGTVTFSNDFWVAVKPQNGPPDGYASNWPPGAMVAKLKALKKGDTVTVKFHTDGERHRIDALEVVQKPAKAENK